MPRSQAEVRWAHAVLEGHASGDRAYAEEVVSKMHGHKMSDLPAHAGKRQFKGKRKHGHTVR